MSTLTLEFAQCRYRLTGLLPEQEELVRARFGALERAEACGHDVEVEVLHSADPHRFMPKLVGPVEYRISVAYEPSTVLVEGIGFSATIDRASLRTHMHTCESDEWFVDAFENLFRVLVSYRLFAEGALVMHSAAFSDGERGFLFCGRSGAGKSTLCGLADQLQLQILSDELNAVMATAEGFGLQAMPFAGDFGQMPMPTPPLPLTGLLGLRQGARPGLLACSQTEAVSRIVASCPYVNADPMLVEPLTDRAVQLTGRVPLRVLSFTKDTTFWKVLDREYNRPQPALSR
ncbi:MAG: hypothetical protein OEM15_09005 [Myxococcales bacterium]|nr:hypothetical protein [Myxococcales bacterium]MDH3484631.1 hypothetical protein [Myxococcales bacterium]